ncbi:MAG: winged helix-turn-helix transcriptional regulator [Verrucomicrobiota bacterium]|nr:winged helix-turn-helix transcriptional regulator [Verrucomicrobiota bacterium]
MAQPVTSKKHVLPVLEAIEISADVSQRVISERTELSLGLVNTILRDLVHRGWIRAQKIPKRRYAYYLTPKGFSEKSRLALDVFEKTMVSFQLARDWADNRAQIFIQDGAKQVALMGNGPRLELAYLACLQASLKVEGIYDDQTQGRLTLGFQVKSRAQSPADIQQWDTSA